MLDSLKSLPEPVAQFAENYIQWRDHQNTRNQDKSPKRLIDACVGKIGEYDLHNRWPLLVTEPDYSRYEIPEFGADLKSLGEPPINLHVKVCSWIEREWSGGWLIAKNDPIVKMDVHHYNNILVFGYTSDQWELDWCGWCWVNEMYDDEAGFSYYGKPRKDFLAKRKYGIWPEDEMTASGQAIKHHGVLAVLHPIDTLEDVLRVATEGVILGPR